MQSQFQPSRSSYSWRCGDHSVELGHRTLIMGILNATPDSFSDGGSYNEAEAAVAHAEIMLKAGADILDIGGESTRPGAEPVNATQELDRVLPVIEHLHTHHPDCLISIDTTKASVAEAAIQAGACIINDVSAGRIDPDIIQVAAKTHAGIILMHMQGSPRDMQQNPSYEDVQTEVENHLASRISASIKAGCRMDQLVIDPGIGFGKTTEHNLTLLHELERLQSLDCPILVGLSRKRFIAAIAGGEVDQRLGGSLAGLCASIERGAHILRVHDVAASVQAARVLDAIRSGKPPNNT